MHHGTCTLFLLKTALKAALSPFLWRELLFPSVAPQPRPISLYVVLNNLCIVCTGSRELPAQFTTPPRSHAHNTRARARATHTTTRSKHANPLPHTQFGAHTDKGFHTTVRPVPRLSQLNASHVPQALVALTHTSPTALVKRKSSNTKTRDAFTYAVILMPTVDALLWGRVF